MYFLVLSIIFTQGKMTEIISIIILKVSHWHAFSQYPEVVTLPFIER